MKPAAFALISGLMLGGCTVSMGYEVSGGGSGPAGALFAETAVGIAEFLPAACPDGTLREERRLRHVEKGSTNDDASYFPNNTRFTAEVSCD